MTEYSNCKHERFRYDNTSSELRLQCSDCGIWGRLTFKDPLDMIPSDAFKNLMRFIPD